MTTPHLHPPTAHRHRPAPASAPWLAALLTALLAALAVGCGAGGPGGAVPGESPGPAPTPEAGTRAAPDGALTAAEFEALYRERTAAARTRHTEADVRFMTDMLHHHGQAVVMARMAATHEASSRIQTLAARILNSQVDEIRLMRRWLEDRGYPAPVVPGAEDAQGPTATPGDAAGHAGHGGHAGHAGHGAHAADTAGHAAHHHDMPGMLTPRQLQELDQARGLAFDRRFLEFMIEHHRGAVVMVGTLFSTDGAAQDADVFRFASDVQVDQVTEIDRMERMLAALPPERP
jgi:uncharacterized protein (DUF305 family)